MSREPHESMVIPYLLPPSKGAQLKVGDRIGKYVLLRHLAAGGMGEVFVAARAAPIGFGPYVALKVLREELACDRQFVDMLVDEANISMFLDHPNVVSVLDLDQEDGRYFLAMEYVQGTTVERMIDASMRAGREPPVPSAIYIGAELCAALSYAHTRTNHAGEPLRIVHRDVTPGNILLSTNGAVKLTDFGIARARNRTHRTQTGVLKGKLGYLAPEMLRYERVDARADIFCTGICLYLMMTGRHPGRGAGVVETIQMFEERRIPPPQEINPNVSHELGAIVMKAMEPNAKDRWASAAELREALLLAAEPKGRELMIEQMRHATPKVFEDPVDRPVLDRLLELVRRQRALGHENVIEFPDSSSERVRIHEALTAEPALPSSIDLLGCETLYDGPTIATPPMSFDDSETVLGDPTVAPPEPRALVLPPAADPAAADPDLDWSDDAAARRAVAGSLAAASVSASASASIRRPIERWHSEIPFLIRYRIAAAIFCIPFVLLAAFAYLWVQTPIFWPTLKLTSTPSGAVVTVDGTTIVGKTPIEVRVEPEKRHLIELRLEGHQRAFREITESIRPGRAYTLTVELAPAS